MSYPELDPDPDRDPLVSGTNPGIRIRIHTKMLRIPNTGIRDILVRIRTSD
jgi:hypothetical protein